MRKTDAYLLCKRAAKAASVHFRHRKRLQLSSRAAHCARPVTSRAMGLLAFSIIASNNSIMLLPYISIQFFAISTALLLLLIHTLCSSPCNTVHSMCFCYFVIHSKPAVILKSCYFAIYACYFRRRVIMLFCYFVVMVLEVVLFCYFAIL